MIFGIMTCGSLLTHSLALFHCFTKNKNVFLCSSNNTILFKFHRRVIQILNAWVLDFMSASAMIQKSFNAKFYAEIDFLIGYFMSPLLMLTSEA